MKKQLDDDKARNLRGKILWAFLKFTSELSEPIQPVVFSNELIAAVRAYNKAMFTYYDVKASQRKFNKALQVVTRRTREYSNVWRTPSQEILLNEEEYLLPQKALFRAICLSVEVSTSKKVEISGKLAIAGHAFIDALQVYDPDSKTLPLEIPEAIKRVDEALEEILYSTC
jgi:hypothetical protein